MMTPSVAIVGAGFGGIGAAAMLGRLGYHDVTVFEKGSRIGRVWNDNSYPGAATYRHQTSRVDPRAYVLSS